MKARLMCGAVLALANLIVSCAYSPLRPRSIAEVERPDRIDDFSLLYAKNCSACHGRDGLNGPAIALANPTYQAIVDDNIVRRVIANGEDGKLMPAFSRSAGGMLTDRQVEVLVKGIRSHWYRVDTLKGLEVPSYRSELQADVAHGGQVYINNCASCHGYGRSKGKVGSITDSSYLALVTDQSLRAIIIAGRPDIGQPDWRGVRPGHPLSGQDVTDLVAWIASQRDVTSGQPYPLQP